VRANVELALGLVGGYLLALLLLIGALRAFSGASGARRKALPLEQLPSFARLEAF
jgi:hypothetical protein